MAPNATSLADHFQEESDQVPLDKSQGDGVPGSTYPGIWKYPTGRDAPLRMAEDWLHAKKTDDDVGSLWRVYDKLYDLERFINHHPGGSQWLEMSRGTDITEAFEASHVVNTKSINFILNKYYVKDATSPRIAPFTFKPDGFYMTLKRRCEPIFKKVGTQPTNLLLFMQDSLVLTVFFFAILGALWNSVWLSVISGIFLAFSTTGAHNFLHIKENWRKYYFDLSMNSSFEWRISHAFSHHMYPNTLMDMELTLYPTFQFLPNRPKPWYQRHFSIIYSHVVFSTGFWIELGKRIYHISTGQQKLRIENLLIFLQLALFSYVANDFITGLKIWSIVHTLCSFTMLTIGATASHHHTTCFHDGDEPLRDPDFGIGQLDATKDRAEDFFKNIFITLISFGHHPLHHLFPTVCHSKFSYVREVFEETVRDFKLDYPGIPQAELYLTCYEQLARTRSNSRKKI